MHGGHDHGVVTSAVDFDDNKILSTSDEEVQEKKYIYTYWSFYKYKCSFSVISEFFFEFYVCCT
jgi:hypothetical protein